MLKATTSRIPSWLVPVVMMFSSWVAAAEVLPQPSEKPILTISGKIGITNKGQTAQFDRPMLESLGITLVETSTPWYQGPMKFEGVSLDTLMKRVNAEGKQVTAIALNDYSSDLPIDDFAKYDPILALKRNGEYMTVRDKGPLFIIYPFDKISELKSQTYYGRSVWQVDRLIVK
jgi:hypothetical protein